MMKRPLFGLILVGSIAFPCDHVLAQFGPSDAPLPSPEQLANADHYDAPTLEEYAALLAKQPDMTGLWTWMQPEGSGIGPTFDPVNTHWGPQPLPGEAVFGPVPGTYLKGMPYNAQWREKYEQYVNQAQQGKSRDEFAACRPYGVPRMIGDTPVAFDIIQSPEVMFWYNNYGRSERRIFLDGRPHPDFSVPAPTGEIGPTYSGHSTGFWEGKTLVVETIGMIAGNYDETAAPYSDQLRMVERMRLIDTNLLEIEMTFTDPVAFEKPWVVTRYFKRGPGVGVPISAASAAAPPRQGEEPIVRAFLNLNDRPCIPNIGIDEDGYQVIILPQELEAADAAKPKRKTK